MQKKIDRPFLALGMIGALMLSGCAAANIEAGEEGVSEKVSAPPGKELTPIEKRRKADPDKIDEKLVYKSIEDNSSGKCVVLGVNSKSKAGEFDPELWKITGKSWTKKEVAKVQ